MGMQAVADALRRLDKVLRRRPESALSADAPERARWQGPDSPLRALQRSPIPLAVTSNGLTVQIQVA